MLGFDNPGDQKVPVSVRDWNAQKLALWRSKIGLQSAAQRAKAIIERCRHVEGCPGKVFEHEPCFGDCPDRENRMDALVILNNFRTYAPANARNIASQPFFAPTRELYSELIAELLSTQAELEALKSISVQVVEPPPNEEPATLPAEPKALTEAEI
jgi:hypothetical protein